MVKSSKAKALFMALLCLFGGAHAQLGIGLGLSVGIGGGGGLSVGLGGDLEILSSTTIDTSGSVSSLICSSGATLTLGSGAQLVCGSAALEGGSVTMEGGTELVLEGPCTVAGSGNTISGGAVATENGNQVEVQTSGVLTMASTAMSPCNHNLATGATLNVYQCAVNAASTVQGAAGSVMNIAQGTTVCNAPTTIAAPCTVASGGALESTNNGPITVGIGNELTLKGGKLMCSGMCASGSAANVVVGTASGAAAVACRGSTTSQHAGGVMELLGQSQFIVEQGSTHQCTAATVIAGSGTAVVAGTMQAASATVTCAHSATNIANTGKMLVSGTGQFVLSAGHTLTCAGCAMSCANVGTQNTHVVGCDTCGTAATIVHTGSSTVSGGHNFLLKSSGLIHVAQGATCTYTGATQTSGAGKVLVEGTLVHSAAYTSSVAHTVTGSHVVNAANACSFGSLAYGSASQLTMMAGSSGYKAMSVAGHAQLGGTLHLKSGSYAPGSSVTLLNCGSSSGTFSSVTSDSTTNKGQVHITPTSVVWYPKATGTCTAPSCCQVY
jgi:hypothetical protein